VTALAKLIELARKMAAVPASDGRDDIDTGALLEEIAQRFDAFAAAEEAERLRLRKAGLPEEEIDRRMNGDWRD